MATPSEKLQDALIDLIRHREAMPTKNFTPQNAAFRP